ncbi:MAG: glycogen/starch/alpha-glucan family phosphorylase, partial [Nitrospinaceae bacterium]
RQFLDRVRRVYPKDLGKIERLSIVEEGPVKSVRMAHLAIVGSHTVNGVAELHSKILREQVFKDFHDLYPKKFQNKTNGITQRLWLKSCNPELASLISETIGSGWITHLEKLKELTPYADDAGFRERWRQIKHHNKLKLSGHIKDRLHLRLDPEHLFDVQVKRIHEYKRQLLCLLHVINLYVRFKETPSSDDLPRTVVFAGKAAPGYAMAKLIIKLINSVADVINSDPTVRDRLRLVFVPNYSVHLAEIIIPAADLSEQISTAGMEASGTGNMKLSLNGALTIGTLDGANVEIMEEVGRDHMFIFGHKAEEVQALKTNGYRPYDYYQGNTELKRALSMIQDGYFLKSHPHLFQPLIDSLLKGGDPYLVLADFKPYVETQRAVERLYMDQEEWTRKSILNTAGMGKFSSDRAVREYAKDIWNVSSMDGKEEASPRAHAHL